MKKYDVAGLGQCALDFLFQVPDYPASDSKCEATNFTMQGGGPVATAMVALRRLGLKTAFLGRIGDDFAGNEIVRGLQDEGVDTRGLVTAREKTSQVALIVIEEGTAARTIFWTRGTAFPLNAHETDEEIIKSSRFLHLDGLNSAASIAAADLARKKGIPVMLDAGTLREEMLPLLPLVDYLVVAKEFARSYSGGDDLERALQSLAENGARLTCITLGEQGCLALAGDTLYRQQAFKVQAVDTTGCGDAFHGGLIYALLQEWETGRSLQFASAVAALKCRAIGGRAALPWRQEVTYFLKEQQVSE